MDAHRDEEILQMKKLYRDGFKIRRTPA